MLRFFRRHQVLLFSILVVVMAALTIFGIGGSAMMTRQQVILKINDAKITQTEFDQIYNQLAKRFPSTTEDERKKLRSDTLQELIRINVLNQQAEEFGLEVPDQELQLTLAVNPNFQTEGQFDWQKYSQTVSQQLGMRPKDFEAARKKDMRIGKLTQLLLSSVHIPEAVVAEATQNRIKLETDPAKKKEMQSNPDLVKRQLREKEASLVYQDWIGQLNSRLNVRFTSSKLQSEFPQPGK